MTKQIFLIALSFSLAGTAHAASKFCENLDHSSASDPSFYSDNPTYKDTVDDTYWHLQPPASQGMDATKLDAAAAALGARPEQFSFLVIRNGQMIYEKYFH